MLPAIGYALREQNLPFADEPAWTAAEVDFQRADHPLRVKPYLSDFAFEYVSVHTLELSVCSPEPPERRYLDAIVAVAEENGAVAITDHLGFTHGERGGAGVGHVTAPPFTGAALDATCRNIEHLQRVFGERAFFVENLAHFFLFRGEMDEAEFLTEVLRKTGCGLLLDVTNAWANQLNFGIDATDFLRAVVPAASRMQMHLAGGFHDPRSGRFVDSHSEPIPEPVWQLYREALWLAEGKVEAVFIERDWNFPDEAGWREEVRRARRITEQREAHTW